MAKGVIHLGWGGWVDIETDIYTTRCDLFNDRTREVIHSTNNHHQWWIDGRLTALHEWELPTLKSF